MQRTDRADDGGRGQAAGMRVGARWSYDQWISRSVELRRRSAASLAWQWHKRDPGVCASPESTMVHAPESDCYAREFARNVCPLHGHDVRGAILSFELVRRELLAPMKKRCWTSRRVRTLEQTQERFATSIALQRDALLTRHLKRFTIISCPSIQSYLHYQSAKVILRIAL